MSANGGDSICTELEQKIIRQIEYYFGDYNLASDKFLKQETAKDDGWVPIETLLTFNRMKQLTLKPEIVVNAMKKSNADIIEINDDATKLRRNSNKPLPEFTDEYKQTLNERSIHAKGFPLDVTLDKLIEYCKQFGTVEALNMRHHLKTKKFKGCIFVVFANKEDAQKMLDSDELKYEDHSLLRENKVRYWERKKEFYEQKKNKNKRESKEMKHNDEDDEMDGDDGAKKAKMRLHSDVVKEKKNDDDDDDEGISDDGDGDGDASPVQYEGAILRLKGVPKGTHFMAIKQTFMQHGRVVYVERVDDNLECCVRFSEKDGAKVALEKAKIVNGNDSGVTKVEIEGKDVIAEVLSGADEVNYWTKSNAERAKLIPNNRGQKRGYNKSRGKKGFWQKGGQKRRSPKPAAESPDSPEATASKVIKTEETSPVKIKAETASSEPIKTVAE